MTETNISIKDNLQLLYILRNLTILLGVIFIFVSIYGLKIDLPQNQLWLIIFSVCIVNLYTWIRLRMDKIVTELEIFAQLVIDVLLLSALIYFTGGSSNPIIWVLLLPLILTSIMLPQIYAWNMVILTSCTYTILMLFYVPLPAIEQHIPSQTLFNPDLQYYMRTLQAENYFSLHIFGMLFGFIFSASLVAFFVVKLSNTLKEKEKNLYDTRKNALRDEYVISLASLATNAAHDMGTPLGTIAILTHEIALEYTEDQFTELHKKLKIISQQISRCKKSLVLLSASTDKIHAESGKHMSPVNYIDKVLKQWRANNVATRLHLTISPDAIDVNAKILADVTLTYSIINILNNAAMVSPPEKGIEFNVDWDAEKLQLQVRDFGRGFPKEVLQLVGKHPVISTKQGLGVGLFLTYSTISRLGGKINFTNLNSDGACVDIMLPLIPTKTAQLLR